MLKKERKALAKKLQAERLPGLNPTQTFIIMETIKTLLSLLPEERRHDLFKEYCAYCGCDDPKCNCWNDE
jgi:hypothetical protein